jgi:lambda family phage portal protein
VLDFADMESLFMAEVFEAGEVLPRKHYVPFGPAGIPFALEIVEPERLPEDTPQYPAPGSVGQVRMGVEVDSFQRPIAYWVRNSYPGDIKPSLATDVGGFIRIPARDMWHLKLTGRWPQTRGEPWLHTAMRKLNDMDGYSEAEIVAARGAASYMAFIKTDTPDSPLAEEASDGTKQTQIEPGIVEHLAPGEDVQFISPNRPNAAMDPFMRLMLREVAAGIGVSYESLSRDYSQTTYSSGRLALLDDRDLWRFLQQWYIRTFRAPLHREWLRSAVMAGKIPEISIDEYMRNPRKFEAVRFKPRGWSWVDPTKEVEAFKSAVRNGFTTVSDVIAKTADGRDLEDVLNERKRELELMREAELSFDTDPEKKVDGTPAEPAAAAPDPSPQAPPDGETNANDNEPRSGGVLHFRR